ncbi:hypothetical protein KFK09_010978 [Dendrobium nobile]|uniref:Secreted protein n=1 Tax=Dendrobium nobile TaxID=94219 RepID=A0A8T3BDK9_DENNO|nr:hypothetical protein KFK09_010978 [Dendrobium nobile]
MLLWSSIYITRLILLSPALATLVATQCSHYQIPHQELASTHKAAAGAVWYFPICLFEECMGDLSVEIDIIKMSEFN